MGVAADLARWVLPVVVLGYFWPVFLSDDELERRDAWPALYRFPTETALVLALIALDFAVARRRLRALEVA